MTEDAPTPAAPGSHVFVSYASQDGAVANSIVESLESQGLRCWIAPRDVKPGAQYADAIVRAINEAKAVVLVMSASAVASSHVGKEIERASSKRKPIIAFRIDAAPLNHALEYFLSESQWIDVRALGMAAALNKINGAVGQGSATSSQAVPDRPSGRVGKRAGIAAAVVVAISVAVGLGFYIWKSNHGAAQTPAVAAITDKSIAVLPFVDMSEKKDQEYFGDGMAEEIIDLLVKVPGLKVTGRTSSFQFKGHTEDLRTVGEKLGVRYVLEGSIRKSGDRLRVTAQLVDSRTGTHLLSQTYDRDLSDVLKMQDEIAASLVRALQIEVSAAYLDSRSSLRNPNAYTLYLKAWHVLEQYDQQGLEQAASYFQQALDLDPSFADAADGLASTYIFLAAFGFMPTSVAYDKARLAVEHALKLDPKLAMAHAILGDIHYTYDWDWPAADRVDPPEHLEQLRVADLRRVEPHLDRLGVAGAVPADLLVGGVRGIPAGVAGSGLQHPVDLAEGRLDTPEASRGECRALGPVGPVALERRRQRRTGVAVPELHHVITPSNLCANANPEPRIPAWAAWAEPAHAGSKPRRGTRLGSQPARSRTHRLGRSSPVGGSGIDYRPAEHHPGHWRSRTVAGPGRSCHPRYRAR